MSTEIVKQEDVNRSWYVLDLDGQVLGRAAAQIARVLRGKHKAIYSPSVDAGDFVVVLNAGKVKLTGLKAESKVYHHYTGFPGGLRTEEFVKRFARRPELVIQEAVEGMLPKNKLGKAMAKKLKVYRDDKHPHQAQKPESLPAAKRA